MLLGYKYWWGTTNLIDIFVAYIVKFWQSIYQNGIKNGIPWTLIRLYSATR